jgi:hypothetical protein
MTIPTFSTKSFSYDSARKTLIAEASELFLNGFPKQLAVQSHHTGRTVLFGVDLEAAMAEEFWDGEQMVYRPLEKANVKRLVIIND